MIKMAATMIPIIQKPGVHKRAPTVDIRNLELPAVEKVVVEFYAARERILDEIYDVSSYYKRLVSPDQERISHFYEFPPDVDIGIRNFMP